MKKKNDNKKKIDGIDYLRGTLQSTFDEHDRLLYHKQKLTTYYDKTKSQLGIVRGQIRLLEDEIKLIEGQKANLKNTLNSYEKERLRGADHCLELLDQESEPIEWYLRNEEFENGYPFGLNIYIEDNSKRIDSYSKYLENLKNRREFLERRLENLKELLSQIESALFHNKVKGMISTLRLPSILSDNLNNRQVPLVRPKTKKK